MKIPKRNNGNVTGSVAIALHKALQHLSFFLQQHCARLNGAQLRRLLVGSVLLGTACCGYVTWQGLQSTGIDSFEIAPIKAFPLPPAALRDAVRVKQDSLQKASR